MDGANNLLFEGLIGGRIVLAEKRGALLCGRLSLVIFESLNWSCRGKGW